ncbi:MAG: NAD/FAD-utilizing enzyme [Halieaceae bacterium]|nr:NAD/FAD-utilizing enzyme [Halieaceae bacterium]
MKRRYFLSNDLDDLDRCQAELMDAGLATPQIHVLSHDEAGIAARPHLTPVEAVLKKDVVHGTEVGAVIGVAGAALVLAAAWFTGVTASVGWVPFIFLAIIVLGFCTWEGGLFGIQETHKEFARFGNELERGNHVFFVDVTAGEEALLNQVMDGHPHVWQAGEGSGTPELVVHAHKKFNSAMETLP